LYDLDEVSSSSGLAKSYVNASLCSIGAEKRGPLCSFALKAEKSYKKTYCNNL